MELKHLTSSTLAKPLDIFSHCVEHNGLIYVSCMQGFIAGTLNLPSDNAAEQAEQALKNLSIVLVEAGSDLEHVIKITTFFTRMDDDFVAVNDKLNKYFPYRPPARSSIGVSSLPKNCKVVFDCLAAKKGAKNVKDA